MSKQITVSDKAYDTLLLRAGSDKKITYVVDNLIGLSDHVATDLAMLGRWTEAAGAKSHLYNNLQGKLDELLGIKTKPK